MLPEEVAEPREDSGLKMASLVQPSLLSFCTKSKYYWRQLHNFPICNFILINFQNVVRSGDGVIYVLS